MAMPGDQHEIYYGITLSTKLKEFGANLVSLLV